MKRLKKFLSHPACIDIMILSAVYIAIAVNTIVWLTLDQRPPAWDQSTHFLLGMDYLEALRSFDVWRILTISNFYPPLYHLTLAPFIGIFRSVDGAVLVNLIYLGIAIFSLYALTADLFNRHVGLLAALLFSLFPFVHEIARECMIDLPLTAWVCLSLCALIGSRCFAYNGFTWLFIASAAAGMLTKWNFIFFLCVPFGMSLIAARPSHKRKGWLSLAGIALLCSPWYLVNAAQIIRKGIRYISIGGVEGDPGVFTMSSFFWYPLSLGQQVFQPVAGLFLFTIIVLFIKQQRGKWVPLVWIGVPLIIHTLISNKDLRYTLPCLPAVAMIIALWLLRDGQRKIVRVTWITSVLAILSFQTVYASYGFPFVADHVRFSILQRPQIFVQKGVMQKDWRHKEIFEACTAAFPDPPRPVRMTVVSNHPFLHSTTLRCYSRMNHLPFEVQGFKRRLGEFSPLVLFKTNQRGPGFTLGRIERAARQIQDPISFFNQNFKKYASIPLPDGSSADIYRLFPDKHTPVLFDELDIKLDNLKYKSFTARTVHLSAMSGSSGVHEAGFFKRIHISCKELDYKGIILNDLSANFENVRINVPYLMKKKELFFLDLRNIELSVRLRAESLKEYVRTTCPWLKDVVITMDDDRITCSARAYRIPVAFNIRLGIDPARENLWTKMSGLKIYFVPVPHILYAGLTDRVFSLTSGTELPFDLSLKQVIITEGSLIIQ